MGIAKEERKRHPCTSFKSVFIFALRQTLVAWRKPVMGACESSFFFPLVYNHVNRLVYKKGDRYIKQNMGIKTQERSLCYVFG